MNARPRMPYTTDGTDARFWMLTSMRRFHQRVLSAYSSR
jgi:hypothetical protein